MGYSRHTVIFRERRGQAVIEFTFGMILVLLMVYALMSIFHWSGVSLAERRIAHENSLVAPVIEDFNAEMKPWGPETQIDPFFYRTKKVKAVWGE